MALTSYTTYGTVRAVLGVASTEITDTVLALSVYEQQFVLEMEDIDGGEGNVKAQYDIIAAIMAGSRSATQQRFYDLVQLFAAYSVARQLLGSAEMFAPKKIMDGKASVQRVDDAYAAMRLAVQAFYTTLLGRIKTVLLVLVPSADVADAVTRTFIVSTGLGTDPVLNT